jgi:hypothetical protein
VAEVQEQDLITGIRERMEGDVEKREVSPGGNGREAESERGIPGRRIIGTAEGYCVDNRWLSTGGRGEKGAS